MSSKYRAVPTTVDGVRFASKKEAKRYGELRLLEKAGQIKKLQMQGRWGIVVNGHKICTYVSDFEYQEPDDSVVPDGGSRFWRPVVEDVKGFKTPSYRLKKKLMKACYGIDIREV